MNSNRAVHHDRAHAMEPHRGSGKAAVIVIALTILLLASLLVLSFLAGSQGYRNLLMATPLDAVGPGLAPARLEDFIEEEFLLTYEIPKSAMAQAVNQRHSVTVIGTNSHYAELLGYVNLDGGFFTATAMDAKQRHAALNETAAFQIFGGAHITGQTLKLDGENWIITGVIQDGDADHANVYVPSSITGGQAKSIIALMDDTVTEAHAKNALKSIGIHESGYDFIHLHKSANLFGECFAVSLNAALLALLLALVTRLGRGLLGKIRFYRKQLGTLYFRELVARYPADFLKTAGNSLLLASGIVSMLLLSLQILRVCLTWQEAAWITGEQTAGDFGHRLIWLRDMQPLCFLLFAACIAGIVVSLILWFSRQRFTAARKTKHHANAPALYGKSGPP